MPGKHNAGGCKCCCSVCTNFSNDWYLLFCNIVDDHAPCGICADINGLLVNMGDMTVNGLQSSDLTRFYSKEVTLTGYGPYYCDSSGYPVIYVDLWIQFLIYYNITTLPCNRQFQVILRSFTKYPPSYPETGTFPAMNMSGGLATSTQCSPEANQNFKGTMYSSTYQFNCNETANGTVYISQNSGITC